MHPDAQLLRRASRSPEELLSHVPHAEGYLAAAVIYQAFVDSGLTGNETVRDTNTKGSADLERQRARQFLLSKHGEWAEARETWAVAANLCPDFVRGIALKLSKNPGCATTQVNKATPNAPRLPRQVTIARVRERVKYLKSQSIDIATHRPCDVAQALTAGGFTTPRGFRYDGTNVIELKKQYLSCVRVKSIEA